MKVQDIMTRDVAACAPDADVASVTKLMWDRDCGVIPVVDAAGQVAGMVTDRDICIGLATKGRTAAHVSAREVMSQGLHTCLPDDDVTAALDAMKAARVRRLPVIDRAGHLQGILSLNDIVLRTKRKASPSAEHVVDTLKSICEHRSELLTATA